MTPTPRTTPVPAPVPPHDTPGRPVPRGRLARACAAFYGPPDAPRGGRPRVGA